MSHRLEGPICLRRHWNHRFLTLESEWDNELRHACAATLIKKLVSRGLPSDASEVLLRHLEESQATGSQLQAGHFSLHEGNDILLTAAFANKVRARHFEMIVVSYGLVLSYDISYAIESKTLRLVVLA